MLDELKKLKFPGGKEEILYFICDVIGLEGIDIKDAEVVCAREPGRRFLHMTDLLEYCSFWGWLTRDGDYLKVSQCAIKYIEDKIRLNEYLIENTLEQLFDNNVCTEEMFEFDITKHQFLFKNEYLSLSLSTVRNVLVSQGFLIAFRELRGTRFYVNGIYENMISQHCKSRRRKISIDKLKERIQNNELAGETAELFVMEFEKKRLGSPLDKHIKRISEIDVMAGYDIVSYNNNDSEYPDRFIEVKAVSKEGFYWSKNEYKVARLLGNKYCLYLVSLHRIKEPNYEPNIIKDPANKIMRDNDYWIVDPTEYHVKEIL